MEREKLIALVQGVQKGDEDAMTEMYNTFHDDIYYYIYKTVNDSELAADLTQDTFIHILQSINTLKEPVAFITWSRQIAYRRCTDHFKKRREIIADEDEDGYSIFDTVPEDNIEFIPEEALDQEEFKQAIHQIINELSEEQRSAILMRYFNELSVAEIAEIQGVSEGTVKSRLNYGRKAIRQAVEDYEQKHNVKLHSVGIIPLLLWLMRRQRLESGLSLTTGAASTTGASAAISAATGASAPAAASTATTVATVSASTVAATTAANVATKAVGGALIAKIVAGIVAASIAVGGVALGVSHLIEHENGAYDNTEEDEEPSDSDTGGNTPENDPPAIRFPAGTYHDEEKGMLVIPIQYTEDIAGNLLEAVTQQHFINKDGKYCFIDGSELDLSAAPVKIFSGDGEGGALDYWDAEGNFHISRAEGLFPIPSDGSLVGYQYSSAYGYYIYYIKDGHLYRTLYNQYGAPDEEIREQRIYIQSSNGYINLDEPKITEHLFVSQPFNLMYETHKSAAVLKLEDGTCCLIHWDMFSLKVYDGLYMAPAHSFEGVDQVYDAIHVDVDTNLDTPVYSKIGDRSHLYFQYYYAPNAWSQEAITIQVAMPAGYTTDDLKNVQIDWWETLDESNTAVLLVEFTDGSVYYLHRDAVEGATSTDSTLSLTCHEQLTQLGKAGHIRAISNIAYQSDLVALMDDGCTYRILID